ncbi:MAG: hypothetical protein ABJD11_17485 [Gemmatimonadota bacterium]
MRRMRLAFVTLLFPFAPLAAQNAQCAPYSAINQEYNVCNAAIDGAVIFHPVVGLMVSGGSPVIGSSRTLGGLGHVSITARVNASQLNLPDLKYDGTTTTVASHQKSWVGAPIVEVALGIFKGLPGGLLSIDALGSATLLPTKAIDNLSVDSSARHIGSLALGLGYGARVGITNGRSIIPSISVSAMHRDVPTVTYGNVSGTDNYSYSLNLHATNLRVMAGYKLAVLNVSAGLGWDKYTGTGKISFVDPITSVPQGPLPVKPDQSRTLAMADAAIDLPIIKIAAEVGYQFGKAQTLATTFQGNSPADGRLFVGAGLRIAF